LIILLSSTGILFLLILKCVQKRHSVLKSRAKSSAITIDSNAGSKVVTATKAVTATRRRMISDSRIRKISASKITRDARGNSMEANSLKRQGLSSEPSKLNHGAEPRVIPGNEPRGYQMGVLSRASSQNSAASLRRMSSQNGAASLRRMSSGLNPDYREASLNYRAEQSPGRGSLLMTTI